MKKAYTLTLIILTVFLMLNMVSAQTINDTGNQKLTNNTDSAIQNTQETMTNDKIAYTNKKNSYTYYASTKGLSTNNGTSSVDAWDLKTAIRNIQEYNNSKLILEDGRYEITDSLTINSSIKNFTTQIQSPNNAIMDAKQSTNILKILPGINIKLENITFKNAKIESNGSAIYNEANLEINNCTFENNHAYYQKGGAIYNKETLIISNSTFIQNKAEHGGAIYNDNGQLTIKNSLFESNNAYYSSGGAIYNNNPNQDKTIEISSNKFNNNTCDFNGGGTLYNNGQIKLTANTINSSYGLHGGAIYNIGLITIDNNTFENNTSSNGPVIYNMQTAILTNNIMTNNNASVKGGAIYNMGQLTITNNTITDNYSPIGGAIYNALGMVQIKNNTITSNTAKNNGGAIYNQANMNLEQNIIENNTAKQAGAIYNQHNAISHISMDSTSQFMMDLQGNITVTNNTFKNNQENTGKEIYNKGQMTITENEFIQTNNTSDAIIYNDEYEEMDINAGLIIINNNTFKNINKIAENDGTMIFTNNTLIKTSDKHILNNSNLTYYNNTIINRLNISIKIDPINTYYHDNITINATFTDEIGNKINTGRAIFKLNDKTYKDKNNNQFINITDGRASINYQVAKGLKNITVIYEKNKDYNQQKQTTDNITINKKTANMTIKVNQTIVKSTNQITITVHILDNTTINDGKVVFKLNQVTIKDKNNNPIYVNVIDSKATLTYTIPYGLKGNNYTITAVYGNDAYNRLETNTTITVEKLDTIIKIDPVTTKIGTNATLKAKIYDEYNNLINKTQKLVVKLNGLKIGYVTATDGIINEQIPTSQYTKELYELSLTVGTTYRYNQKKETTTLTLKK